VYVLHFASNVVRETYLAISLGERFSVRVDEYMGLHPDLFEIPGRGAYINNNPGASMLGSIPYAVARPVIDAILRANPRLTAPKPAASYDDPRPNRTNFMNEARARGLDIKLALAAAVMHAGLMAPLGAIAAVVLFAFLRARLNDERLAMWMALLYAFGTPIFFRSAFLNQNAILAHCVLFAYVVLAWPRGAAGGERGQGERESRDEGEARARGAPPNSYDTTIAAASQHQDHAASINTAPTPGALVAAGAFLGIGLLNDYSAMPLLLAFGIWILALGWRRAGAAGAIADGLRYTAGAAGPIALLLAYQWVAFGNPLFPAQRYMPATRFSVRGWNGLTLPSFDLLWRNLLDPAYGLLAFCPMLVAAVAAPFIDRRHEGPGKSELWLIFGASFGLYLFNSANQFATLQWNTGVRYMVPAVPLLFIALIPVLRRAPRFVSAGLLLLTLTISWSVAMARENVPLSLARIFTGGFELPWLTVLEKTSSAYAPFLEHGTSPIPLFCLTAAVLWLIWRNGAPLRGSRH
jgi:hypothetical protein